MINMRYALFNQDGFVRVQYHDRKPDPNSVKNLTWYDIGDSVEGSTSGWSVVGNEAIQTIVASQTSRRAIGTFSEFIDVFTTAEQTALIGAARSDNTMKLWYDRAVATNSIDLASSTVINGMNAAVAAGLLTEARKTEVIAGDFNA